MTYKLTHSFLSAPARNVDLVLPVRARLKLIRMRILRTSVRITIVLPVIVPAPRPVFPYPCFLLCLFSSQPSSYIPICVPRQLRDLLESNGSIQFEKNNIRVNVLNSKQASRHVSEGGEGKVVVLPGQIGTRQMVDQGRTERGERMQLRWRGEMGYCWSIVAGTRIVVIEETVKH